MPTLNGTNLQGKIFFNQWQFFTGGDPTHGTVNYVDHATAEREGLISYDSSKGTVYIGADYKNVVNNSRGRDSVRITSSMSFDQNTLFIMDLNHMPAGCGTWPAWWLVGPNWPNSGEIDIIEGVNTQTAVATTLHTSIGCNMSKESSSLFTGHWGTRKDGKPSTDCWVSDSSQYANEGCGIIGPDNSYGAPFNANGGGVYVCEWTSNYLQMFFFPRSRIPSDITNGNPNPKSWGKPYAYFTLGQNCPNSHFRQQTMIINLTFCGDWAGSNFGSQCPNDGNCSNFVQKNPKQFQQAYWEIRSITVYE